MGLIPVMIGPITLFSAPAGEAHPSGGRPHQPVKWGAGDGNPSGNWEELFTFRTKPNTIKWRLSDERSEVKTGQSIYAVGEVRESGMVEISGECFDLRMGTIARLKGVQATTTAAGTVAGVPYPAFQTMSLEQGHHVASRAVLLVGQSPDIATKNRGLNLYIPCATLKGPDEIDGNETEPSSYSFLLKAIKDVQSDIATLYSE